MKLFLILIIVFSLSAQRSYDYDKLTKEQYDAELLNWRNRNNNADLEIKRSQREIDSLSNLKQSTMQETTDLKMQILAAAGENEESFNKFMSDLNQLRSDVTSFSNLSSEEIYKRKREIDGFEKRLAEFKKKKASKLSQASSTIRTIEDMIAQIRQKATLPNTMYEVVKGDYLWKIAKKGDVYGDAYAWTRIYNSNKNLIKDPNLIFPKQTFSIPRSVESNQYLVVRGDNLAKISEKFGNTFTWFKLYQMNKDLIEDQSVIYPYQVLSLPNN